MPHLHYCIIISQVIERVINAMDTPVAQREVEIFLTQLGQRHQSMGVEKKFLDVMGPIFCNSITTP